MARRKALIVFVAALVVAAGALGFLFLSRRPPAPDEAIQAAVARMDRAIEGGYLSTAADELDRLTALPRDEGLLLRLARRAFQVSSATGDFAPMARLLERALKANGSSHRLRLVASYAYLRAGRLAQAQTLLRTGLLPRDLGEQIKAEATLRGEGAGEKGGGGLSNGSGSLTRELLSLEGSADPAAFSAAAARTGDARLSLDAALLEARSGAMDAARAAAQSLPDGPGFDEPAALIEYDAGAASEAVVRLRRAVTDRPTAERELLLADALQGLGAPTPVEAALAAAVARQPDLSWTAHANLAYLAAARGSLEEAAQRLSAGMAAIPDSQELAVAEARVRIAAGDREAAAASLSALVASHPDNIPAALLLLELRSAGMSPGAYRAALWRLFSRAAYDGPTYLALLSALVSVQDWPGAAIAVRQHRLATDLSDGRMLVMEGFIAAMRGDLADAQASFQVASGRGSGAGLPRDGSARYDLALVLLKEGKTAAALAQLDLARTESDAGARGQQRAALLSRIAAASGMARIAAGDPSGGRADLGRAVSLDPSNLRARLLLDNLEPEGQQ